MACIADSLLIPNRISDFESHHSARWGAAYTYPRYEKSVADNLMFYWYARKSAVGIAGRAEDFISRSKGDQRLVVPSFLISQSIAVEATVHLLEPVAQ
jgi:hypothetical protein